MKKIKLAITMLVLCFFVKAQKPVLNEYAATDKKALEIPDSLTTTTQSIAGYINANFSKEKDKARAAFIWVASNIQYDIENMYAINFYESNEDKIDKALKIRKGICENYASIFNDVCLRCGIKSYIIKGYSGQSGSDYLAHVWCTAYIDTAWRLFDPTWGSGYIAGEKFVRKINNNYFYANPESFIKTHMPFDYLWQLLYYTVTNQEFYESKTMQNQLKPFFNYVDSIKEYEHKTHIEQLTAAARRIEKNGLKNSMIFDRLQRIKVEIENDKIQADNKKGTIYNEALAYYNDAVKVFNDFINYRNHQFKPARTDAEIQGMIDSTNKTLDKAKGNLRQINNPPASLETLLSQFRKSVIDLDSSIKEQQNWLNLYFNKSQAKRKLMFYEKKVTWFGVPLN